MDFRQLRTFSCVAELGSLSKASDTLRVAQPALSRQIKLLEHELRADLFTRNGRGMVLTDAGRVLLARTAGIVRQIDQWIDDNPYQRGIHWISALETGTRAVASGSDLVAKRGAGAQRSSSSRSSRGCCSTRTRPCCRRSFRAPSMVRASRFSSESASRSVT